MYLGFVARLIFALVFLVASLNKLRNPTTFTLTIQQLGFSLWLARVITWLVIGYEFLLALLFFSGFYPVVATIAALILLLVFIGVSSKAILTKQKIACNCFGESKALLGKGTQVRAALLAIPVICYYLSTRVVDHIWWPTNVSEWIILSSLVIGVIALSQWLLFLPSFSLLIDSRKQKERRTAAIRQQPYSVSPSPSTGGTA